MTSFTSSWERKCVLLLGPSRAAVSGVSTHLNQLFDSQLSKAFVLRQFQVGSEGLRETSVGKAIRLIVSPLQLLMLVRKSIDIVHINTSLETKSFWRDLIYLFIARLVGARIIYQVHGGSLPAEFFDESDVLTRLLKRVLLIPDAVVLLAHVEMDAYSAYQPKARLVHIPNAVDATAYSNDWPVGRYDEHPLHLVYIGRFAENKGLFEAVQALSLLVKKGRNIRLSLAGSGPDDGRLKQLVAELGLSTRVEMLGPVFDDRKIALLRASHVFVFPTYHREGLPYALLECMAAGAVPVTTRVGAIPDVMTEGVHGRFVESRDAVGLATVIASLDDDRAGLVRMALAGSQRIAKDYSIEKMSRRFGELYSQLSPG